MLVIKVVLTLAAVGALVEASSLRRKFEEELKEGAAPGLLEENVFHNNEVQIVNPPLTQTNPLSHHKRSKRAIFSIFSGIATLITATDTVISIANLATDGNMYYPSIKENEVKIKELLREIKIITPKILELERELTNATTRYEESLYYYKGWAETVTNVLLKIKKSQTNTSDAWIYHMQQRLSQNTNSKFWQIYKLLAVPYTVSNVFKQAKLVKKHIKSLLWNTKLGNKLNQLGNRLKKTKVGSLFNKAKKGLKKAQKVCNQSCRAMKNSKVAKALGKIGAKNILKGVGASLTGILSGVSIGIGVMAAKDKRDNLEKRRKMITGVLKDIKAKLARAKTDMREMEASEAKMLQDANKLLQTIAINTGVLTSTCSMTKESFLDDIRELQTDWENINRILDYEHEIARPSPSVPPVTASAFLVAMVNSGLDTAMILTNMKGQVSNQGIPEEVLINQLRDLGAVMPSGKWSNWVKSGSCDSDDIDSCIGTIPLMRTCKGSCLGSTTSSKKCLITDRERCNNLPLVLRKCIRKD